MEGLAGLAAGYAFDVPAVGLGRAVRGEEVNTIHARYGQTVDPDSAYERLTAASSRPRPTSRSRPRAASTPTT